MGSTGFGMPRRREINIEIAGLDIQDEAKSRKVALKKKAQVKKKEAFKVKQAKERATREQQDKDAAALAELNQALRAHHKEAS